MKRKVKKYADGDLVEKEGKGFFGETQKWKEDKEGRKFTDSGNRYYSADDVKSKLSGLFGGKKEEAKYDDSKSVGDANKSSSYYKSEEAPRRQISDYVKKSESTSEPTGYKEDMDEPAPRKKAAPKKASPDAGFTKKDTRTTKDAGFTKKDTRTTKDEGFTKKEPVKSVVFKRDIFRDDDDDEPVSKPTAPAVRKVVKDTVTKVSNKAADTTVPKAFDMKTGNKTVYGTKTTDVFRENEERRRKAIADKEAKKAKSDEENREFRSRSLSPALRKGGAVKKMASGGMARSSASKRADGCAIRGKTRA